MNRILAIIVAPIVLTGIGACSNQQKNEALQGYLATHVFDDGSKQFVYTIDLPDPATRSKGGKGSGRPGNATGHVSGGSTQGLSGGVTAGTGNRRPGGKTGGSRNASGKRQDRATILVNALDDELKKSGFCRDGYMELDRMMEPRQTFIRGECIETATDHDREVFPNETD